MSFLYFDSRNPCFKKPFGAIKTGEEAEFRLCLPKDANLQNPRLLLFEADEWTNPRVIPLHFYRTDLLSNVFLCTLSLPSPELYFYCFEVERGKSTLRIARGGDNTGVLTTDTSMPFWQLTVYAENFSTPEFLKGGLIYQIFPDRFAYSGKEKQGVSAERKLHTSWEDMPDYLPNKDGEITNSDYFCGDLIGITEKLDYLVELGVTCIYLNPVFEAHSSHRYNTADYMKIDPLLGTNDDLKTLCAEGKKHGISVVLDGVFSHTGDDSVYFNKLGRYDSVGAYQSKNSPYYNWYNFQKWPDKYAAWWNFITLPNVDETNPEYVEFICGTGGVLEHWLSLGVAGFRLDVADELPDTFLDALTRCVKEYNPAAVIIGEVWEDASNKIAYGVRRRYFLGTQLDSVMNYPFRDAILGFVRSGNGQTLNEAVLTILENYPAPVVDVLMNCLSTHDIERAITVLAGEPMNGRDRQWQRDKHFLPQPAYIEGKLRWKLATVLQFFLPGVPSLYYGDEVGLSGYRDPFNRCPFPWAHIDEDLLAFTRALSAVRREYRPLLTDAPYTPVCCDNEIFSFTRTHGTAGIFIAVNRGDKALPLLLPQKYTPIMGELIGGKLAPQAFFIAKI